MKEFFEALNKVGKPGKRGIIEKDFHLHRLLHQISMDEYLSRKLAFKGGTCLIKAHLNYYRFSEDIDFTWKDSSLWERRNQSETRRKCSEEIDILLEIFKEIADALGMGFGGDKKDKNQVHISSGGRMVVFYIEYYSDIFGRPERLKIETNFVEQILLPLQKKKLGSYAKILETEELMFYYKDQLKEYNTNIELACYDPQEIFIEKCRAALTRKVYKLRDIIDIYKLEKVKGYTIEKYSKEIMEKTRHMIDLYSRYKENIEITELPETHVIEGEEMKLFIENIPPDFEDSIHRIHIELEETRKKLLIEV
ncbi:MAG: nucleotidyl transferase AbiEii/AbiGii toxin family protein [Candidatus Thermoplasmatota archaeon]|nr:nucleotidyl transferase AbiEii/AbiGii toxin family protein [Candidatus Thermoplasmatota archaeon]